MPLPPAPNPIPPMHSRPPPRMARAARHRLLLQGRGRPFIPPLPRPCVQRDGMPLDLPAVLVEDVLRGSEDASASLLDSIRSVQAGRSPVRRWLEDEGLLLRGPDDDADAATACGIDGSYVLDHMLTTSVAACAAVAIEGFVPPRHGGFWPVRHRSFVGVEAHSDDMPVMVRGLMRMMEAGLAAAAPHEVVLLDGSAASQIIHAHQAMSAACRPGAVQGGVASRLRDEYPAFLGRLATILESRERTWASLPKFTALTELGDLCRKGGSAAAWPGAHDDKSVLTAALAEGEYTRPVPLTRDGEWRLRDPCPDGERRGGMRAKERALAAMAGMHVLYYKPHAAAPALRVEVAAGVAADAARLNRLLSSLRHQHASYSIMEPYPLYMADRMVKSLGGAVPLLAQSAMRRAAAEPGIDLGNALLSMRGYRTEIGM